MTLMHIALEWGCLPDEVLERIDAATFWEFVAFFKIRNEQEKAAIDSARNQK